MITEKMRKKEYVRNISTVLAEDPRSGVEYIEYDGDFPGGLDTLLRRDGGQGQRDL